MSWKGDPNNNVPNTVQSADNASEKNISDLRGNNVRRDTDKLKNYTISLYDIDSTIMYHLEQMNLQVEEEGKIIKVPIFAGSPEKWVSAQRDGFLRDKQGKIILPAIILKRTTSQNDPEYQFFNRYLTTSVRKLYSPKNRYTKFSLLNGSNAPVNEIYNITMPSPVKLTYHFIIWTSSVEQMNKLVENLQYNTGDYWGYKEGLRFRTIIESFSHVIETQQDEDRVVKTEFDLITHGYILPESITNLEAHKISTQKMFSKKKVVLTPEVVSTGFEMPTVKENDEKWRNPNYPNLQIDTPLPVPPVNLSDNINVNLNNDIYNTLKYVTDTASQTTIIENIDNTSPYLKIVSPPSDINSSGKDGYVSYDSNYFYIYSNGTWKRTAISQFS